MQLQTTGQQANENKAKYQMVPWRQIEMIMVDPTTAISEIMDGFHPAKYYGVPMCSAAAIKPHDELYSEFRRGIEKLVYSACDLMGIQCNQMQVSMTARAMMSTYYMLKFEEFVAAVMLGITGELEGSDKIFKGRFSIDIFTSFLRLYDAQKRQPLTDKEAQRYRERASENRTSSRGDEHHLSVRSLNDILKNKKD